jgi:predicted metal-dependent phosphoesterase TrpH
LHIHTRRYSPCAELLNPDCLPELLQRRRLEGAVLTEHDVLWSAAELAALNVIHAGVRIYRGMEVSSCNGHFVVIGLTDTAGIRPGITIHALVERAAAQQAAVICVHPYRSYQNTLKPLPMEALPAGIHAVEVVSSVTRGNDSQKARALATRLGLRMVGGSDAHAPHQVGCAWTIFEEMPADEQHLAALIRSGRCRAGASAPP